MLVVINIDLLPLLDAYFVNYDLEYTLFNEAVITVHGSDLNILNEAGIDYLIPACEVVYG